MRTEILETRTAARGPDFKSLRARFPVLAVKTYLNSGSYGALATDVKDAFESYLTDRLTIGAEWALWIEKNEAVRSLMAQVINAAADEVAITASASAGINAVASALDFTGKRNKVVVSDFEFPTNAQIWHAQEPRGAEVVHVPVADDGYIPLEHFERAIDDTTLLVAITHVCYRNGRKLDIPGIVQIARAKGAMVLLDCYQSLGAEVVDVKALDVDFMVGGMLKYLLGTAGIGFLYVRDRLIEQLLPTTSGWFAQADIVAMDITGNRPSPTARRFEAGTPAVSNCYASEAGLKIILEVGPAAIERRVKELTQRCTERLLETGCKLSTSTDVNKRGPTVTIRSTDQQELVNRLMARDIVTSCRDGNIRAAFHFYNNDDDIEVLVRTLTENRDLLA